MTIDLYVAAIVALFGALTGLTGTIWHALLTGRLVFGRELDRVTAAFEKSTKDLDAAQVKERESLQKSLQQARDELGQALADLRDERTQPPVRTERTG